MDTVETRSPLQTKNPNVMASKLRPPSAIKRSLVRDTSKEPKTKVPKCDLSVKSKTQNITTLPSTLRRQTSTAVVRRTASKPDMPPPSSVPKSSTLRRQTSATQIKRGTTTTSRVNSGATKTSATSKVNVPKTNSATSKRAKWDYKGRLEDMEKQMTDNAKFMNTMNESLNNNKERIEFLESVKRELEHSNEIKSQRNEESSAKISDLEHHVRALTEENNSLKLKHEFEIEVKMNKIKSLEKEQKQLERDLAVSKDECNALKSTIAQMTAQSYGIRTELEATKLNLQNTLTDCSQKENTIRNLTETIELRDKTISQKEAKLRDEETLRRKLHNTIQELKGNIRVFCRVRPPLQSEKDVTLSNFVFSEEDRAVSVEQTIASQDVTGSKKASTRYDFTFDKVFNQASNQEHVFEEISQLVQSALDGYNVCIFAYGQTGSGKTYTMEGNHNDITQRGMIPRSMELVFETSNQLQEKGWEYKMEASFLEIYNENIRDLLGSDDSVKYEIKMVDNGKTNVENSEVMVTNLKIVDVTDQQQVYSLLKTAAQNRAVGATKCNERSSRSHSVFTLKLTGKNHLTHEKCQGTLNLVDLAGSERLGQSGAEGQRLKETKNINSSLSNLSNVIMALANKETRHVPYRNSKLTYLLKNSLGGNSKSLMFVNVSPREDSFQETLCSLRFATKVNQCNIGTAQKKVVK